MLKGCLEWSIEPNGHVLGKLSEMQSGWHRATLKMEQSSVLIAIDGVEIYRGRVVDPLSALFGLYQESDKIQVRVRKMKLTGDWPNELPENWLD
jgi:hypothetical protein